MKIEHLSFEVKEIIEFKQNTLKKVDFTRNMVSEIIFSHEKRLFKGDAELK
jgi:hypothetical protein